MSSKPDFSDLFFSETKDFLDLFLSRQQQRSPQTVKAYRISLTTFYEYVKFEKGLDVMQFRFSDCTYDFVLSYSQYLQEQKKLSNSTVNQRLAALKSYMKYVADKDVLHFQTYMAVQKVPLLKIKKLQRPVLEKEELKSFLESPADTVKGNRDMVLLTLLFDSAIRASELSAITLGDVLLDTSSPSILIHGKGKKERVIGLNPLTAEHLKNYIQNYHQPDASPDTPLFYTVIHGQVNHMSERNIERIVKKYGDQVRAEGQEMPDRVYPHLLRRSRATGLYRDGVPLEMISALLGHSNSETTKIYAAPSVEQMRGAIEKAMPKTDQQERLWEDKEDEMRRMFGLNTEQKE